MILRTHWPSTDLNNPFLALSTECLYPYLKYCMAKIVISCIYSYAYVIMVLCSYSCIMYMTSIAVIFADVEHLKERVNWLFRL